MVMAVKKEQKTFLDGKVGLTYMKSFEIEQKIRREGIKEGKAVGKAEGKAEAILDILGELGDIPLSVRDKIALQKDADILRTWLKLAAKAENIQDFAQKAFTT